MGLKALAGLDQGLLRPLMLGDVGNEALQGNGLPRWAINPLALLPNPAFGAVPVADAVLRLEGPARPDRGLHAVADGVEVLRQHASGPNAGPRR